MLLYHTFVRKNSKKSPVRYNLPHAAGILTEKGGFYLSLFLSIRLMGKRQLGQMEPTEFVVTMLIADLASVPMQDEGIPLLSGLIPILVVLAIELLLSVVVYHSVPLRRFFCGKPVVLMENGRLIQENMKKTRVNPDELTEFLRIQGVTDLTTVQYAILETNGSVSALLYPKHQQAQRTRASRQTRSRFRSRSSAAGGSCGKISRSRAGRRRGSPSSSGRTTAPCATCIF